MLARLKLLLLVLITFAQAGVGQAAVTIHYKDKPFLQDYSVKYPLKQQGVDLLQVRSDRNAVMQVLSSSGLLRPGDNVLTVDNFYRPLPDMNILALDIYQQQFIYLSDEAVVSNAWAGKFYVKHNMPGVSLLAMGREFSFLLAGANRLGYFKNGHMLWQKKLSNFRPLQIIHEDAGDTFLILTDNTIYRFTPVTSQLEVVFQGNAMSAMTFYADSLVVGSSEGVLSLDTKTFQQREPLNRKLPWPEITCLREVNGQLWFGSSRGAFMLKEKGSFAYYASKRWLLDDHVLDIQPGPEGSVLILSKTGLNQINYRKMTLADKAKYFGKIQRQRHIRYGLSSHLTLKRPGDPSSGMLVDTDNDGLWTSMYLASELFRYAVTQSDDALQNAFEAFEAMEKLDFINPLDGFPSRTYERDGYAHSDVAEGNDDPVWRLSKNGRWRWKSTTSSDESSGHFFAYALFAEIVPEKTWKEKAIAKIIRQMDHIIDNDWYLVSWNGKPTRWGRWNPDYVNSFPINVGDRRLNSTLILAFLQTAYHFSGNAHYREKADELIEKHSYLENALRPATAIGFVEGELLSDRWNHSDDEMYFLTAPALSKYAFDNNMKMNYLKTIKSHWEIERNEKSALWNFLYVLSGGQEVDLDASIWWLKEYPLDQVSWRIINRHRKDLKYLKPNFRNQPTAQILPPDERPMTLHNKPSYWINSDDKPYASDDTGTRGATEEFPPYVYLLPYWMGRYIGVIGAPLEH